MIAVSAFMPENSVLLCNTGLSPPSRSKPGNRIVQTEAAGVSAVCPARRPAAGIAAGILCAGEPASAPGRNRTFIRRLTVVRSAVEPLEHTAEQGAFPL